MQITGLPLIAIANPKKISVEVLQLLSELLNYNPDLKFCASAKRALLVSNSPVLRIPKKHDAVEVLNLLGLKGKIAKQTNDYTYVELISEDRAILQQMADQLESLKKLYSEAVDAPETSEVERKPKKRKRGREK